jgi:hypothetical protein
MYENNESVTQRIIEVLIEIYDNIKLYHSTWCNYETPTMRKPSAPPKHEKIALINLI